jgi:hypothetical protein
LGTLGSGGVAVGLHKGIYWNSADKTVHLTSVSDAGGWSFDSNGGGAFHTIKSTGIFASNQVSPISAAGAFLGGTTLPWAGLYLGPTTANQTIAFLPGAMGGNRTVNIPDPGSTAVNLAFNLTATSAAFATATTAGTCVQNTTAVTGAATTMAVAVSPVSTPGVGAQWSAFVSSAGNVTINECAVALSAGGTIAFNIRVFP